MVFKYLVDAILKQRKEPDNVVSANAVQNFKRSIAHDLMEAFENSSDLISQNRTLWNESNSFLEFLSSICGVPPFKKKFPEKNEKKDEGEIGERCEKFKEKDDEIQNLQEQIQKLQKEIENKDKEIENKDKEIKKLQEELRKCLEEKQKEIDEKQKEIDEKVKEIGKLNDCNKELSKEKETLLENVQKLKKENEDLSTQLKNSNETRNREIVLRTTDYELTMQQKQTEYEDNTRRLEQFINQMKFERDGLEKQLLTYQQQIQNFEHTVGNLIAEKEQLQLQCSEPKCIIDNDYALEWKESVDQLSNVLEEDDTMKELDDTVYEKIDYYQGPLALCGNTLKDYVKKHHNISDYDWENETIQKLQEYERYFNSVEVQLRELEDFFNHATIKPDELATIIKNSYSPPMEDALQKYVSEKYPDWKDWSEEWIKRDTRILNLQEKFSLKDLDELENTLTIHFQFKNYTRSSNENWEDIVLKELKSMQHLLEKFEMTRIEEVHAKLDGIEIVKQHFKEALQSRLLTVNWNDEWYKTVVYDIDGILRENSEVKDILKRYDIKCLDEFVKNLKNEMDRFIKYHMHVINMLNIDKATDLNNVLCLLKTIIDEKHKFENYYRDILNTLNLETGTDQQKVLEMLKSNDEEKQCKRKATESPFKKVQVVQKEDTQLKAALQDIQNESYLSKMYMKNLFHALYVHYFRLIKSTMKNVDLGEQLKEKIDEKIKFLESLDSLRQSHELVNVLLEYIRLDLGVSIDKSIKSIIWPDTKEEFLDKCMKETERVLRENL